MKTTILTFTKTFTHGTRAKSSIKERMRFPTMGDACRWVEGINRKNCKGELEYKVTTFVATKEEI